MIGPPENFYKESWEDADFAMACVGLDNKFVKVNHAFESLLGYSSTEMDGRPWMEFTADEHVGGDLKSVEAVISGQINYYRMEKDYIHKKGHRVPIVLTVRRFPRSSHSNLLCFRVEVFPAKVTRNQLEDLEAKRIQKEKRIAKIVNIIDERLKKLENKSINNSGSGDATGGNKTVNSDNAIKYLVAGFIAMVIGSVWAIYYVSTLPKEPMPEKPHITTPELE